MGDAVDSALSELQAAWQPFEAAVASLDAGDLERTTAAGWTAKEMLAHAAFWDEAFVPVLTYKMGGKEIPRRDWFGSHYFPPEDADWPPFEVHNAREAAWGRQHSREEVLLRFEAAHNGAVEALRALTDEELPQRAAYLEEHAGHYREHLAELQPLLSG